MFENTEIIKELFNISKLKIRDAEWYRICGYEIVLGNGRVENVYLPVENSIYNFCRAL